MNDSLTIIEITARCMISRYTLCGAVHWTAQPWEEESDMTQALGSQRSQGQSLIDAAVIETPH